MNCVATTTTRYKHKNYECDNITGSVMRWSDRQVPTEKGTAEPCAISSGPKSGERITAHR